MKKIFAMILTIAMVLTLLPATALAAPLPETAGHEHVESVEAELAEVISTSETPMVADVMEVATDTSGTIGNTTWVLSDEGVLTISPIADTDGRMADYASAGGSGYSNYNSKSPFNRRTDIKSVVFKDGVTYVGERLLYFCTEVNSVTFEAPEKITAIGRNAFYACEALTSITLPSNLTVLETSLFCYCKALTSITIPAWVTKISDYAFQDSGLTSVVIPEGVTSIGMSAFANTPLASVVIPNSVTTIGSNAFSKTALTSVVIPGSIKTVSNTAFNGCASLENVTIEEGVESIGFWECRALTSLKLPASVTALTSLYGCSGVQRIEAPGLDVLSLTYFRNYQLEELVMKPGLKFGSSSSSSSEAVAMVTFVEGTPTIPGPAFILDRTQSNGYVIGTLVIPSSVTEIEANAFKGIEDVGKIELAEPVQLTTIGDSAFEGLTYFGLKDIPATVTSIGDGAFRDNAYIENFHLTKSVTKVGAEAFKGCTRLAVVIDADVDLSVVGTDAFQDVCTLYVPNAAMAEAVSGMGARKVEVSDHIHNWIIQSGVPTCGTCGKTTDFLYVRTESELRNAVKQDGAIIRLTADITLTDRCEEIKDMYDHAYSYSDRIVQSRCIAVRDGVSVVLDLNGFSITMVAKSKLCPYSYDNGYAPILYVTDGATLHLVDTSNARTGTLKGAKGGYTGGAVFVREGGHFLMSGGTIKDCTDYGGADSLGGGVLVFDNGSTFVMNGGIITGCKSGGDGSAVGVGHGGSFTMNGGKIFDNGSSYSGDVANQNFNGSAGTVQINTDDWNVSNTSSGGFNPPSTWTDDDTWNDGPCIHVRDADGTCILCGDTHISEIVYKYQGPSSGIILGIWFEGDSTITEYDVSTLAGANPNSAVDVVSRTSMVDSAYFVKRTGDSGWKPLNVKGTTVAHYKYYVSESDTAHNENSGDWGWSVEADKNRDWNGYSDWTSKPNSNGNTIRDKAVAAGFEWAKIENTGASKYAEGRTIILEVKPTACDHAGNTNAGTYHGATCAADAYTEYTCSVCGKTYQKVNSGTRLAHTWVHDPSKAKATGFKCGICGTPGAAILIEYQGPKDIKLAYAYGGQLVEIDTPADAGSAWKIAATIVAEVGELENMALFVKRADNAQYKPLRRGSGGNMWEYYTYITSAGVEDWKGKGQWERLITAKDEPGAGAFESIRAQAELKGYELWKVEDTAKSDCDYGAIIGIEVKPTTCTHDNWSDVMGDTATCQAAGTGTQTCLDCGFVKTVTTSQKEHTKVAIGAAVEATCSATGLTAGEKCADCGAVITAQEIIPKKAHTAAADAAVDATCSATGLTAGSHCSVCGEVLVAQTVVPKKAHTLSATAATAPTCSADGNIAYWTCSVCNKYFSDDKGANEIALESTVVGKIAHAVTATAAKAPTCTEAGNIAYTTCASCGKIFDGDNAVIAIADTVIPAKGHTAAADAAVAPTCTATGLTAGSHCSVCGEVLVAQTEVAANGHTWSAWNGSDTPAGDGYMYASRKCSVCGATEATSWLPMTAPTIPDGFLNGTEELDDEDTPLASMPKLFLDVAWTAWYGAAVKKVADAGLMFGVEDGTHFDPEGKLTRSMAVTTIYRLAGCPDVDDEANPFADVPANRWFTDAVIWAAANGIVNGYDDGNFHPDDYVTREQMAAMMYRYILFTGATGKGKELAYVDSDKVSGWAVEAVRWADAMGGIHSRDGELQPTEYASRADVAFILAIFVDGETEI